MENQSKEHANDTHESPRPALAGHPVPYGRSLHEAAPVLYEALQNLYGDLYLLGSGEIELSVIYEGSFKEARAALASVEYEQCLACHEPILAGEFHPCERPENCTDADCPLGATIIGWPHPIEEGCSCFSGEGPTGCMDDGDELSQAMRGVTHQQLYKLLDEALNEPER